ncbi:MAG: hypothetical protein WDM80_06245 [Limisphaerales bacterium]
MPTVTRLILRITIQQPEPRLFVTFFMKVMQQLGIGVAWQLKSKLVNAREQRQEMGLGLAVGIDLTALSSSTSVAKIFCRISTP